MMRRALAPCAPALLALPAVRTWMEAGMARHMLLQLPLLVLAGVTLRGLRWRVPAFARCDAHGLTGLTLLLCASACWMIPRALDASLTHGLVEALKFGSLLLAGLFLPGSLGRAGMVVQLFFLANLCAMCAIAGLLYQEAPQRLCNAYLLDEQSVAGGGLVGLALGVAVVWCVVQRRALLGAPQA